MALKCTDLFIVIFNLVENGCLDLHLEEVYGPGHLIFIDMLEFPQINEPLNQVTVIPGFTLIELFRHTSS